ncbi:phosphoglycolate phosphatase [Tropicimonas isoalkanivorans]|uniref:phosphoglycolate phosphatase n=1 Tax=Tropicimonas isoalkanivorans TaxID=441112 RepID=A0A1I1JN70_9RHOB|nr:phosphoglycolate phosphatase [Tropicimonas isoalkanivorans]SFC49412.1 phosphoglycolate phosphatase [Tropicimonas isoalkanivorans]
MNIVFDLDGTLIDSAPDIQAVSASILQKLGKPPLTLEEVRSFVGEGAKVLVSRMMAARGIEETPDAHAKIYGDFLAEYQFAVDKAVFYPGVVDAFAVLKASGHKLGLCTNKPQEPARAVLRHMGMEPVFDAVISGGMIDSHKPEPDMLLRTIEDLGGGATLYVGDSETDAETARRAGVPFALYTEGYRKSPVEDLPHDWLFDHFDRLQEIVKEAQARQTAAQ